MHKQVSRCEWALPLLSSELTFDIQFKTFSSFNLKKQALLKMIVSFGCKSRKECQERMKAKSTRIRCVDGRRNVVSIY